MVMDMSNWDQPVYMYQEQLELHNEIIDVCMKYLKQGMAPNMITGTADLALLGLKMTSLRIVGQDNPESS